MNIQIYVCSHQFAPVISAPFLYPVQTGAALSPFRFPDCLQDDSGVNISEKNPSYCELTAQYWAWRNAKSDYAGLFHYRRYLYPDESTSVPYRVERAPDAPTLQRLGYARFADLIESCDMIAPRRERQSVSVRRQYDAARGHLLADLNLAERIIRERSPQYAQAAAEYLSGNLHYFCNLFIMRWAVFADYCAWLFSILSEFDRRMEPSPKTRRSPRVDGYLGERLFGIFYTRWRNKLRTRELPRALFEPNPVRRFLKRAELRVLPPESNRRETVRRLLGKT